jgi:transposase-like protein
MASRIAPARVCIPHLQLPKALQPSANALPLQRTTSEAVRLRYLNTMVEQDHRPIKKRNRPMLGFKSFASASVALDGIEVVCLIRKEQFITRLCPILHFANLAAQPGRSKEKQSTTTQFATQPA